MNPDTPHVKVYLNEHNITLVQSSHEFIIPYGDVLMVRLARIKDEFVTQIRSKNRPVLNISSRIITLDKSEIPNSQQYTKFVKTLHIHLKEKSNAQFFTGDFWKARITTLLFLVALCFVLSYVLNYLHITDVHFLMFGALLSLITILFVLLTNRPSLPRVYKPELIPINYLPSEARG